MVIQLSQLLKIWEGLKHIAKALNFRLQDATFLFVGILILLFTLSQNLRMLLLVMEVTLYGPQ